MTGVALISFITLALTSKVAANFEELQVKLIVWIFAMRFLMDFMSGCAYFINEAISKAKYAGMKIFDFEQPLSRLIWIAAILCISTSFGMSWLLIGDLSVSKPMLDGAGKPMLDALGKVMGHPATALPSLWWQLATIISCGTLAAVLIPEFTKVFTSSHSKHVKEIVTASREGGASLTILSGLVAGNFSVFWKCLALALVLLVAYLMSLLGLDAFMGYPAVFAFGLVAFGLLGMGPVTIAVDSYGPVTDNAQSIFELSQVESLPNASAEIEKGFGFKPDFAKGKHLLEDNDGAGNTFKATAKPVLIATAVAGATTMIFSLIVMLKGHAAASGATFDLSLTEPLVLLGLLMGGATVYWFTGASMQAVTTGAYSAVEYIKANIHLDSAEKASIKDSKEVVRICTQYAQKGMFNIFMVIFCLTLAYAFFNAVFFVAYLVSIAVVGLFQAVYMANAGGAWDNAKKVVEVELQEKGTPLHDATVVGDTVGDPYKDTSSVALNPIIKFTTLFGLLAVETAVANPTVSLPVGVVLFLVALFFIHRSFYGMRIGKVGAKL